MADEEEVEVVEEKKGGLVKILLFVTIGLLLIIISVGATLFLSGFFDPKPVVVDEEGNVVTQEIDGEAAEEEEEVDPNAPKPLIKTSKETPEGQKFDQLYNELDRGFTINLAGSQKFVQFSMGFMTHYDQRIVDFVYKHEMAIRSAIIMEVSSHQQDQLVTVADKQKLADSLKTRMNQVLTGYEDFGGIEEVFFTEFVIQ
ncbi:flagellar basal body-associated FliL family protein [Candidatus Njordibacter sp. Uisw_058]|uniref:flagellar basal body-associated FliL family protein n=1 Tax=Candidatus Njordibacter sp. Uisw_058 TaxID=3230974 RepID=UPI003D519DF5